MRARWISKTPKCEIVVATEEIVNDLLGMNVRNRAIRISHRAYLRSEIERGNFCLTNQGIGIDVNGVLVDGQHRLEALMQAGYPSVELLIVYGLSSRAQAYVDLGVIRSMADILRFAFERPEASATMVAVARAYWTFVVRDGVQGRVRRASPEDVMAAYMKILPALESILTRPGAAKLPAPVLAAIAHRLTLIPNDQRPIDFLDGVISGAGLLEDSGALSLRNYLLKSRNSVGGLAVQKERFQKTAAALAAHLMGRKVVRLFGSSRAIEEMATA